MKGDSVIYDLLAHAPLDDVLAFVNARDDVREMCSAHSAPEPPDSYADTIPLPTSTTSPPAAPDTVRDPGGHAFSCGYLAKDDADWRDCTCAVWGHNAQQ